MKKSILFLLLSGSFYTLFSQDNSTDFGQIHGNVQTDVQYYNEDSLIGAPVVPEKMLMNGFANINFTRGNFAAGIRYESYLNALQGFPEGYRGTGIGYRYATYAMDNLEVTAGNFYEQFGSGMILRAYEERQLGYDNAFDGFRLKYNPYRGVYLKTVYGKQRLFFDQGPGIVRGIDGEIVLNELSDSLEMNMKTRITIGGSFVSKFQADNNTVYNLPQNVGAYAIRFNVNKGNWNLNAEYVHKDNDPSSVNNFIYQEGEALLINSSYSQKGFGVSMSAKRIDNMDFRSDRAETFQNLNINFLPALTKQHTYALATIYPYGTITTGEMAYQGELSYKFKKGSLIGGKYGTRIFTNFSTVYNIQKDQVGDTPIGQEGTLGYESDFFTIGEDKFFQEFSVEISKKVSKKLKFTGSYINTEYNSDFIVGYRGLKGTVYANIFVLETQYKIKPKHSIRSEIQLLKTEQHDGDWAMALIEYTISPHYFVAVQDMYNYGNSDEEKQIHYPVLSAGYNNGTTRFAANYGRQRAGIFCVGGVCREIPASDGFTLSITSSF